MTLEVKCRSCGKTVEPDEGLTCRACRLMIRTPFRMKVPSFSELQKPSEPPARTRTVIVFAAITLLLPLLMTLTYWLARHFIR